MKRVAVVLAAVAFFLATDAVLAQDLKKNEAQVVFLVSMDCQGCVKTINGSIPYEKGVKDLTANLGKKLVTIKYQTNKTDKAKLKKAIEKLGFTCEEVKPES